MIETMADRPMKTSMGGKTKTVAVVIATVGERYSLSCFDSFKERSGADDKIIAWYNCINGFDPDYFAELRKRTDDVVVCTKNKGVLEAFGFSLLYLDFDYIVLSACDVVVREGWLDRYMRAFEIYPGAACAGQSWDNKADYKLWTPARYCPDRVTMWSRDAINRLGSISPSFRLFGDGETELFYRAVHSGFEVVEVNDIVEELTIVHEGSALLPNKQELVDRNIERLYRCSDRKFRDYNWWVNNI